MNIHAVPHDANPDLAHIGSFERIDIQNLLEMAIKEVAQNRGLTLCMQVTPTLCLSLRVPMKSQMSCLLLLVELSVIRSLYTHTCR